MTLTFYKLCLECNSKDVKNIVKSLCDLNTRFSDKSSGRGWGGNIELRNIYSPCSLGIKSQTVFYGKTLTGRHSVGDAYRTKTSPIGPYTQEKEEARKEKCQLISR